MNRFRMVEVNGETKYYDMDSTVTHPLTDEELLDSLNKLNNDSKGYLKNLDNIERAILIVKNEYSEDKTVQQAIEEIVKFKKQLEKGVV